VGTRNVGGISPANTQQLLFVGRGLDFQSTADQALAKQFNGTQYVVTNVYAARKTGAATVACVGGIYTAAAKGGSALIGAVQSWVTLASGVTVPATIAITTSILTATPLYLSLTTGSTAAVTADVFVFGYILD
jgi:hypothetical protein